jgi:hypothetical protein
MQKSSLSQEKNILQRKDLTIGTRQIEIKTTCIRGIGSKPKTMLVFTKSDRWDRQMVDKSEEWAGMRSEVRY